MASIVKHKRSDGKLAYRIYFFDHKYHRRTKIIYGNRKTAESIANRIEMEVQDIRNGIKPSPVGKFTIGKLVTQYIKNLFRTEKKESTIKRYNTSLINFLEYFSEDKQIGTLSYADIEHYKAYRLETCTPSGVNIDLRHLRAFLNYCVRMDYIIKSPYQGVKQVKVGKKDVRFLTEAEIEALMAVIKEAEDEDMMDILLFYLNTGARANEILAPRFTWDRVKDNHIELFGKGDKTRRISIQDTLRKILDKRRHLPAPFPYKHDYVYSRIVRKYYPRAGIKNANLHSLRKTAGALLVQEGIDIYQVSRFLGHSSVTVTEKHYADLLEKNYSDISTVLDNAIPRVSEPTPGLRWQVAS